MASLTRDAVLAAVAERNRLVDPIEVPEWGGTIYVRHMNVADVKSTGFLDGVENAADVPVRVLAACLAGEDGEPLFTQDDVEALSQAEFNVVLRVFEEASRINGMLTESTQEAIAAFSGAQAGDSSTA